jgi:amidohydrolase
VPTEATAEPWAEAFHGLTEVMVAVRRDIHAHPELSWRETRTSGLVADMLRKAGLNPVTMARGTGVICDIVGERGGPTVLLRADLDALPIDDEKSAPYRSTTPGVTHACGHDVHTAAVLGAGLALTRLSRAGHLGGRVRLLFQPAEEVQPGGALAALEEGVADGVARALALHCDPRVDAGSVAVRAGAITGATDMVSVRVSGPGGHTARPQLTVDVVGALAEVIVRTPAVLSRRVDPRAGLSLVWGSVAAGTTFNVIPEHGVATGTVRALDPAAWETAATIVPEIIRQVAAPYRGELEVDYVRGVPPAWNDPKATDAFRAAAASVIGPEAVIEALQSAGAEDFAWLLKRVPGVLFRLGVRPPGIAEAPDLHRGDFDVDESAIECGMRVLAAAALSALTDP